MRVLLATLGSRGDVEPFLALALALQRAGHKAVLCASQRFQPWIEGRGVVCEPMSNGFVEMMESLEGRTGLEESATPLGMLRTVWRLAPQIKPLQVEVQRDLWRAARACSPDAIVFHAKLAGAPDIAAALNIPAALLLLVPALVPTGEFACPVFPQWMRRLGGAGARRAGYATVRALARRFGARPALTWRRQEGMGAGPSQLDLFHDAKGRPWPILHAHSPTLLARPTDWPDHAHVTGFLRLPGQPSWAPPDALRSFLDAGPPPVYVGFGSMAGRDPRRKAREVLEGLRLAGVRGVIGRGWGGLQPSDLPSHVFAVDDVPHDWLFPRMAAVVHHGGAGTTAAGLTAGKPTLVCPFFGDQPFWGDLVHERGLGPRPLPQSRLNSASLAASLRELLDQKLDVNARNIGSKLKAEDGGDAAVQRLLRHWIGER
ncbi:glycosyltransferase [Roseateles asaccharophilus]|uniref:Sterol 3beta-glucosyltransferase n=1 Tax=Roseateles asaccharophilus TaxID=582607 RepID=A0ABU2AFZ0_9BURK|nr:glycosyltransferase [Roseateles asaccharophilus]MDR7336116.1 sterol 3beta-glucosyltransferase [Roseateles asaccharophilus]